MRIARKKQSKAQSEQEGPYPASRPSEARFVLSQQSVSHDELDLPKQPAQTAHVLKNKRLFQRRGNFPFLSLPLEIRQIVYQLLLVSIADRLITIHFSRFMPGLSHSGIEDHHNLLLTCRAIRYEATKLLYSWPVRARGFDLSDFCAKSRLVLHPWLQQEVQKIQVLRVRFSMLHSVETFVGRSDVFLCSLPECRVLCVDMVADDWRVACTPSFVNFVRDIDKQGCVQVKLYGVLHEMENLDTETKEQIMRLIETVDS